MNIESCAVLMFTGMSYTYVIRRFIELSLRCFDTYFGIRRASGL